MPLAIMICAIVIASATIGLAVMRLISHKRLDDALQDFEASQSGLAEDIEALSQETNAASTETTALLQQLATLVESHPKRPSVPLQSARCDHYRDYPRCRAHHR